MTRRGRRKRRGRKAPKKVRIDTSEEGLRRLLLHSFSRKVPYSFQREGDKIIYYLDFRGAKKNEIRVKVSGNKLKVSTRTYGISYWRVLNLPKKPKSVSKKSFRNGILQLEVRI